MAEGLQTSDVRVRAAWRGLNPARTVLDNGAVVIAKTTTTTPAVAINLAVRAGSACDPPGAPGTAWLLSRVLDRGTATRSAAEIAEELDRANFERRDTERKVLDEAEKAYAELDAEQREAPAIVLAGQGWHGGVVGSTPRPELLLTWSRSSARWARSWRAST